MPKLQPSKPKTHARRHDRSQKHTGNSAGREIDLLGPLTLLFDYVFSFCLLAGLLYISGWLLLNYPFLLSLGALYFSYATHNAGKPIIALVLAALPVSAISLTWVYIDPMWPIQPGGWRIFLGWLLLLPSALVTAVFCVAHWPKTSLLLAAPYPTVFAFAFLGSGGSPPFGDGRPPGSNAPDCSVAYIPCDIGPLCVSGEALTSVTLSCGLISKAFDVETPPAVWPLAASFGKVTVSIPPNETDTCRTEQLCFEGEQISADVTCGDLSVQAFSSDLTGVDDTGVRTLRNAMERTLLSATDAWTKCEWNLPWGIVRN